MASSNMAGKSALREHAFSKFSACYVCLFEQVLFPLLDSVKKLSDQASDEKVDTSGSMLIHHSRNTAQKQWAETQVRVT